jgi:hypothetical protein
LNFLWLELPQLSGQLLKAHRGDDDTMGERQQPPSPPDSTSLEALRFIHVEAVFVMKYRDLAADSGHGAVHSAPVVCADEVGLLSANDRPKAPGCLHRPGSRWSLKDADIFALREHFGCVGATVDSEDRVLIGISEGVYQTHCAQLGSCWREGAEDVEDAGSVHLSP